MTENSSKQKKTGLCGLRAAAAVLFLAAGGGLAVCSACLLPEGYRGSVPAAQAEAGGGTENVRSGNRPVIWYSDTALCAWDPATGETTVLADLQNGGMDRMTMLYTAESPADRAAFTQDGNAVWYTKNFTTGYLTGTTGDLFRRKISGGGTEKNKTGNTVGAEEAVASGIVKSGLTGGNGALWLDSNENLYFLPDADASLSEGRKLMSGVTDYRVSEDGRKLFLVTDFGGGWAADLKNGGEPVKIAAGIQQIEYASDDLSVIYYSAESSAYSGAEAMFGTQTAPAGTDMYCIKDLKLPEIVDVDITQFSVIKHSGHLYYLKKEADPEMEERQKSEARVQELIRLLTGTEESEDSLTGEAGASSAEEADDSLAEEADSSPAEEAVTSDTLYFFDGTGHKEVTKHVAFLDDSHSDDIQKDRIAVRLNEAAGMKIGLAVGEKMLDTGLNAASGEITDYCPDLTEDVFYFGRKETAGDADPDGTLWSMNYTEDGFGPEEKLFDGAAVIPAACAGRVFTGKADASGTAFSFNVNGVPVSDHAKSYFWDETGEREEIQIYRNVFEDTYAVSGELDSWSGVEGEAPVPVVYGVREYHAFDDGSFTFLTDYDEERCCGTLVYWDHVNPPEKIADDVIGTKKGLGEE